jgi:hypothetical protein
MSKAQKLVNKLKRKERKVRETPSYKVKMDLAQETLVGSPGAYKLVRGQERRADASFGYDAVKTDPILEYRVAATSLERFDFDLGAGEDYGLLMTMPAGLISAIGIMVGDTVEVRETSSQIEGRMLTVVALSSATELRLDDVATFTGTESTPAVRFILSGVKKSFV